MNKPQRLLLLAAIMMAFLQCQIPNVTEPVNEIPQVNEKSVKLSDNSYDFHGNGKQVGAEIPALNSESLLEKVELPRFTNELIKGLNYQLKVLNYRKKDQLKTYGKVDPSIEKLEKTVQLLLEQQHTDNPDFTTTLDALQLEGDDGLGSVYFTGYFTPVLKVSRVQTDEFKYPIYARPKNWSGKLPTRRQIDGEGVLKNKGLEIAYTKNLLDIYFMQIQGSGIVEYPDGSSQILAFAGANGHKYRSVGKYLMKKGYADAQNVSLKRIKKFFSENPHLVDPLLYINESYVFFSLVKYQKTPKGAGHVPLTTEYSIAVDKRYIQIGSCLLAKVPIINKRNQIDRFEYRILIAQDVGGAIKGPGRVDLYTGVGDEGRRKASALHHYGSLWLLLPKESESAQNPKMTASL
jgi:membrane-bound lytic murein transglycosylase A